MSEFLKANDFAFYPVLASADRGGGGGVELPSPLEGLADPTLQAPLAKIELFIKRSHNWPFPVSQVHYEAKPDLNRALSLSVKPLQRFVRRLEEGGTLQPQNRRRGTLGLTVSTFIEDDFRLLAVLTDTAFKLGYDFKNPPEIFPQTIREQAIARLGASYLANKLFTLEEHTHAPPAERFILDPIFLLAPQGSSEEPKQVPQANPSDQMQKYEALGQLAQRYYYSLDLFIPETADPSRIINSSLAERARALLQATRDEAFPMPIADVIYGGKEDIAEAIGLDFTQLSWLISMSRSTGILEHFGQQNMLLIEDERKYFDGHHLLALASLREAMHQYDSQTDFLHFQSKPLHELAETARLQLGNLIAATRIHKPHMSRVPPDVYLLPGIKRVWGKSSGGMG